MGKVCFQCSIVLNMTNTVSISNHVEVLKHLVQAKSNVPAFTFSPNLFRVHLGHDSEHCQKYEPFVLIISKITCKVKYACSG